MSWLVLLMLTWSATFSWLCNDMSGKSTMSCQTAHNITLRLCFSERASHAVHFSQLCHLTLPKFLKLIHDAQPQTVLTLHFCGARDGNYKVNASFNLSEYRRTQHTCTVSCFTFCRNTPRYSVRLDTAVFLTTPHSPVTISKPAVACWNNYWGKRLDHGWAQITTTTFWLVPGYVKGLFIGRANVPANVNERQVNQKWFQGLLLVGELCIGVIRCMCFMCTLLICT